MIDLFSSERSLSGLSALSVLEYRFGWWEEHTYCGKRIKRIGISGLSGLSVIGISIWLEAD